MSSAAPGPGNRPGAGNPHQGDAHQQPVGGASSEAELDAADLSLARMRDMARSRGLRPGGAGAAFATAMFAAPGSTASTRTCAEPCFNMPSRAAAAYERSMMRPSWKGPRSLMRTTTDLPFSRWVTRT